jgi:hypothetical protein
MFKNLRHHAQLVARAAARKQGRECLHVASPWCHSHVSKGPAEKGEVDAMVMAMRSGPTGREVVLTHAVARLVLDGYIDNIQVRLPARKSLDLLLQALSTNCDVCLQGIVGQRGPSNGTAPAHLWCQ